MRHMSIDMGWHGPDVESDGDTEEMAPQDNG